MTDAALQRPPGPRVRTYVAAWIGLLCIAGLEVALVFAHLPPGRLVAALLALALAGAGIGLLYFMHLKFERRLLLWSVVLSLIFVLLMMNQFWSDARRLLALHF